MVVAILSPHTPQHTTRSPLQLLIQMQVAHAAGDALVAVALAGTLFFSVPVGQARDKVGLYLLLTMAPFAVLSPVIAPVLDRWRGSYKVALLFVAGGRALLALYMATRTERLVLYPLAFALLVLSRAHVITRSSLIPEVLPDRSRLVRVNALMSIWSIVGASAGAGIGVAMNAWLGPVAVLRAASVVFAVGAWRSLFVRTGNLRRRAVPRRPHVLLSPRLIGGGIGTAAARLAVGFLTFVVAFALRRAGEGAVAFGIVAAAAGVGTVVGAITAPFVRRIMPEGALVFASLAFIAIGGALLDRSFGAGAALPVAAGITALGATSARLAFDSLVQRDAPEEVRGRAFARYETLFQLAWVIGAGAAALASFDVTVGLRIVAAIAAVGFVLGLRRTRRPAHRASAFESG